MLYTSNLKGNITIIASETVRATISPGSGMMDDHLWEAIAENPTVMDLIEQRFLEVNEPPAEKTPAKKTTEKPPA